MAVSASDGSTPVAVYADPTTHRLYVDLGSGGTVTDVSVVTAQGVSGSVASSTTTPAITLTLGALTGVTSFNGLVVTANTGAITTGSWAATAIPLSKGGTGADLSAIAKGGLIVGTAANTVAVKAVGTDGQVLTADAASAGGVKWATGATGPVSSTDNAIVRFDGTGGATLQNSLVTVSDDLTGYIEVSSIGDVDTYIVNTGNGYGFTIAGSDGTGGGGVVSLDGGNATAGNTTGGYAQVSAGNGFGSATGGDVIVFAGTGGATGGGGYVDISAGPGGATSGAGGYLGLSAGDAAAGNSNGGDILLYPGKKAGSGTYGKVYIYNAQGGTEYAAVLDAGSIATSSKTFTFPNVTGTLAVAATSTTATQALFATTTAGAPEYRAIAAGDLPATLSSGTAITNAALTTPRFADLGYIADSSGNELIVFDSVASAVNELTVTNAATGDNPLISATGGDANISINFQSKGTGVYHFKATNQNSTRINLFEDTDNGTDAVALTVPSSLAASYTVTLPAATDTLVGKATTDTLTNKRITKRVGTTTSSATPTINTDNVDMYTLTAQAADITSFTTNLSGTPTDGQTLWIAITGTAARAITWGASFEASGNVALPTTTVTTARLDVGFVWNAATSKWRCVATA